MERIPMISLILCLLATISVYAAEEQADFYIAPDGLDTNAGTMEAPFGTLQRARDAVRSLKAEKEGDITVLVRGGRYEVTETAVFGLADSGTASQKITYAAYPGETPRFSAGQKLEGWARPQTEVPGLPAVAQPHVLELTTSAGFLALFDEEGILPRARSARYVTKKGGSKTKVILPKSHFKEWLYPTEMEVMVRPHHAWILNILPVSKIDAANHTLHSETMGSYSSNPLHFLPTVPNSWVENAIEELDEPGEWVLNRELGKLYLWPRSDSPVFGPVLHEIVRVEGAIDFEGASDTPVQHLHFKGLTFMHGERYQVLPDDIGIQHDWDFMDKGNALVRFRGTENCLITDCHFLHSGGGALRLDLHSVSNTVANNVIEHIGGGGVLLCGYGPGTKDVNHSNLVYNNHIHHIGEVYWHSAGIIISHSGENRIANNLIHHTNYTGIIVCGIVHHFFQKNGREVSRSVRWHEIGGKRRELSLEEAQPFLHTHDNIIENNEIHHAMQELGDGNAIYIRGSGAGNIIRRNYVHHLITPMIMQCAIRTDGGQRDTLITENIIYKCMSQGVLLKLNNRFENNIVADVLCPPRGYYLSLREGPLTGATVQRNVFYASGEYETFISELNARNKNSTEDSRGRPLARIQDANSGANLYYSALYPEKATAELEANQAKGADLTSVVADPLFKDPANGDFRLAPNSPLHELGFKEIDQSKIGLVK